MRDPFRAFAIISPFCRCLSLSLFLSLSLARQAVVHETINTVVIVFGAAAFTRPPEQEVVQVPEEKKREVSNKNINSNNCYETATTRVVASLFRESFSDVCIYDCCIFVYHILFSSVCVCVHVNKASIVTNCYYPYRRAMCACVSEWKCATIPLALKKGETRTVIIIIHRIR